jgi:hypothetical protein
MNGDGFHHGHGLMKLGWERALERSLRSLRHVDHSCLMEGYFANHGSKVEPFFPSPGVVLLGR